MAEVRDLPQAELEVLGALWRLGKATVREVRDELGGGRAYTTLATLLNRLEAKGYVGVEKTEAAHVYRPLAAKEEIVANKLDQLVNQVLGGDISVLLHYALKSGKLSPKKTKALQKIVKAEGGKKK